MNNQLHQETLIKVFYWYILPLQIKLVPQKGWMRAKVKQSYNKLIMSALLCVKKIKYLTACLICASAVFLLGINTIYLS